MVLNRSQCYVPYVDMDVDAGYLLTTLSTCFRGHCRSIVSFLAICNVFNLIWRLIGDFVWTSSITIKFFLKEDNVLHGSNSVWEGKYFSVYLRKMMQFICSSILTFISCETSCVNREMHALLAFKNSLHDLSMGCLASWNNVSLSCCEWEGVPYDR